MEITINANPKEIAALVVELQERRRIIENPEEFSEHFLPKFQSETSDGKIQNRGPSIKRTSF